MHMSTQRITVTLPSRLAELVRKEAKRSKRPVSRVIAEAVAKQEEDAIRQRMIEGYKEFAALNKELAEEFWPIAGETWPDD